MARTTFDLTSKTHRINRFISEYLGTSERPVAFGGRKEELAALDIWLDDSIAPSCTLVTGPAGCGKSALLVRWINTLIRYNKVHLIFIPASIRFNMALKNAIFSNLALHLSKIYKEPVKQTDLSAEQWRDICYGFLSGESPLEKPLLVILDGLDQIVDWQIQSDLFPPLLSENIRLVVSARAQAGE